MKNEDSVYEDLQKHLDKQAIGFPATESGVEIRILKELFDPEQARLALHLNFRPQSISDIFHSVRGSGLSRKKVRDMLEQMVGNGAIGFMEKDGTEYYFTMPLLVGILEWHDLLDKATPQFWRNVSEYMNSGFRKAYTSTRVSQMRTIPVEKSIRAEQHVSTYDHIREIINSTDGPISIQRCVCREGKTCKETSRLETCMGFGDWAKQLIKTGIARDITREQALEIMRQNEEDGLVLQPTNYQKIDFVCACCGCCCGILNIQKRLPKPAENWAHNFYSSIDTENCTACGTCVDRCQMDAIFIDEQSGYAAVNLDRCIGCGNCVVACPSGATTLVKKAEETVPPEDRTSLFEILAER